MKIVSYDIHVWRNWLCMLGHFMIISSDYSRILRVLKLCGENNYLPSMIFFLQKTLFKIVLGRTFSINNRFSKFLRHILGQTKRKILQRKIDAYN